MMLKPENESRFKVWLVGLVRYFIINILFYRQLFFSHEVQMYLGEGKFV